MLETLEMKIPQLGKTRKVRVYTPSTYDLEPERRLPVLYMHDGHNLFDVATSSYGSIWAADQAVETLIREKGFGGLIVVGVDCAPDLERLDEYSPWVAEDIEQMIAEGHVDRSVGGEGVAYGQFLVETLKPYIDTHYRTLSDREHTAIGGSSMGGLMSLYMGAVYPEVFGKVCAMSTASWFAQNELEACLKAGSHNGDIRWYLDCGTKETEDEAFNLVYLDGSKAVCEVLSSSGVPENQIKCVIETDAIHNETAWARRLPEALCWLFECV